MDEPTSGAEIESGGYQPRIPRDRLVDVDDVEAPRRSGRCRVARAVRRAATASSTPSALNPRAAERDDAVRQLDHLWVGTAMQAPRADGPEGPRGRARGRGGPASRGLGSAPNTRDTPGYDQIRRTSAMRIPIMLALLIRRNCPAFARDVGDRSPIMVRMPVRHFVKYTFLKVDPAWRRLERRASADKREFIAACEDFADGHLLRAFSLVAPAATPTCCCSARPRTSSGSTSSTWFWPRAA